MVAEDAMRDAPSGDSKQSSVLNSNSSEPTFHVSTNSTPTTHSDAAGPNRRDDRNKHANGKFNANGRRRGQDFKRNGPGRGKESRGPMSKRERNEKEWQERKRRRLEDNGDSTKPSEPSYMSIQFPEEEIAAEERKPKRKVAVMIGYDGTGYHGLQINHKEKTIEGDIFAAFVAANAISKANADDLRKSSFVRCARTDKGVHAAGNMISLKLIIQDPDVVKKINENLPPQIRVWGIQRTNNSFSCYQACDSRWYEYLMPSYCLLPPHPESFLGKNVLESAKEHGVEEEYAKRLGEVKDYWDEVRKNDIQPILDSLDPNVRETVMRRMNAVVSESYDTKPTEETENPESLNETSEDISTETKEEVSVSKPDAEPTETSNPAQHDSVEELNVEVDTTFTQTEGTGVSEVNKPKEIHPVDRALKQLKAAYVAAKRRYRVTPDRISQLQQALDQYKGTNNFHNYTIRKQHSDPSSKRTIRSFIVNPQPIQINDTEWLSLKVHGQSFMMHQIRKMVGMAVLVTRCATPFSRIKETYESTLVSIPKAPSLGLLLERPVFETYNKRARDQFGLAELDFGNYEKEIQEFKDSQIYRHIFELEERENSFHTFFHQIDNYKLGYFLWVTAGGIDAAVTRVGGIPKELEDELGDDGEEDPEE
ncbi:pseudouridine synthase [Annulohypoxylon maeteangense]|uniref:pseudouridine synthase n=1 Tax=Annulohypoxylon maeteangense TaxID=1927788 RepID=UPI002007BA4D|nr:pseudouridine synthase [Annulohypoxylon maeteangense]KAI0881998.1 pseudouridine synthase [Annulohypoxylon maeteangense]